jgi:hypothetical protein
VELNRDEEKTRYMLMSREQNAGKNHCIKTGNKSLERVANENIVHEKKFIED